MKTSTFIRGIAIAALVALTACAEAERDNHQAHGQNHEKSHEQDHGQNHEQAHEQNHEHASSSHQVPTAAPMKPVLTTYKSASCGCCKMWVEHASGNGFAIDARDVSDLNAIKEKFAIAPEFQSCHTSVSPSGYVFEGHIPAKLIRQFLQNPPADARGLAVPAMPLGSPGMEVGDRFTPYQVLLLHKDGSHSVYARIDKFEQQH